MGERDFRFKLHVLLKRQIRRELKFQKALAKLRENTANYLEDKLKRENLCRLIDEANRVSFFHVEALQDIISNLHGPPLIGDDESVSTGGDSKGQRYAVGGEVALPKGPEMGKSAYTPLKGDV